MENRVERGGNGKGRRGGEDLKGGRSKKPVDGAGKDYRGGRCGKLIGVEGD